MNDILGEFFSYDIMRSCWRPNPKERPTFGDLVKLIDSLLSAEAVSNIWLVCKISLEFYSRVCSNVNTKRCCLCFVVVFAFVFAFAVVAGKRSS